MLAGRMIKKKIDMISKTTILICIILFTVTNAFCTDSYCYRNSSGSLFCEKSLDSIPQEFRGSAFYKEIKDTPAKTPQINHNLNINPPSSGLPPANSYKNNHLPTQTVNENNLPSRLKPKDEVAYDNQDVQATTELPAQNQPSRTKTPEAHLRAKSNVPQIEVFVAEWCPHCKLLEAFLKKENISYIRYDVEEDAYGREVFEEENGGIPITKIGGTTVIGFEERKFKSLIDAQQPY